VSKLITVPNAVGSGWIAVNLTNLSNVPPSITAAHSPTGQPGIVFQRNDAHPREAGVGVAHLLQRVWRLIDLDMQVGGLGERHVAGHGCVGDPG